MRRYVVRDALLKYIIEHHDATFALMESFFENYGYDYKGDAAFTLKAPNEYIGLWNGWNEDAFDIIKELRYKKRISWDTCEPLLYERDGNVLDLPLFYSLCKPGAHGKMWLPIIFNPVVQ